MKGQSPWGLAFSSTACSCDQQTVWKPRSIVHEGTRICTHMQEHWWAETAERICTPKPAK